MKKQIKVNNTNNLETEDLKNQLARVLADYDNLRKRVDRERQDFVKLACLNLIVNLLPILDQLEEAQKHLGDQGLAITIGQLKELIKDQGVEEIKCNIGDTFDENLDEATETIENIDKSGIVAEVVLSGWKFVDGPVIRHTKVKVYK